MKNKGLVFILCLIIAALIVLNIVTALKCINANNESAKSFDRKVSDSMTINKKDAEIESLKKQVQEYENKIAEYENNNNNIIEPKTKPETIKPETTNQEIVTDTKTDIDTNIEPVDNVDSSNQDVFLRDFENYNPEDETIISAERAREIAQIGFEESAKRIAGEGADNVESEQVKLEEVYANNYFTRKNPESDKIYSNIRRACYVVQRENEMGCGIKIYVDATTGLIIGGNAYGD